VSSPGYQPPPDITSYVDLRVFDRTDQEIFDGAVAALQANMPDWVQREGNTEVLLLEAVALELSEGIVAVNRVLEALLQLFEVFKDYGAAPTATALISVADTVGHTIPAGTRIYLPSVDGTSVVTMLVEPPGLTIPAGSTTGIVSIIGDTFTAAANGSPAGSPLQLASPLAFIDSITLASDVADGRDAETDDAWRDRGVAHLARLSSTLVTAPQFEAATLERPEVTRAIAVDNTDPTTPGVGDDPGHVTVAVLGDGGAALSSAAKALIEADLEAQAVAVLDVHVTDVAVVTVTLTATITTIDATAPQAVADAVEQAIIGYIDPTTWAYGTTIWRNELISLIDQVDGVDRVVAVTITGANGSGDYPLPSASTVPRATAASVTVTLQ
jgi:uncharacterized phage protein gp47/JayE